MHLYMTLELIKTKIILFGSDGQPLSRQDHLVKFDIHGAKEREKPGTGAIRRTGASTTRRRQPHTAANRKPTTSILHEPITAAARCTIPGDQIDPQHHQPVLRHDLRQYRARRHRIPGKMILIKKSILLQGIMPNNPLGI